MLYHIAEKCDGLGGDIDDCDVPAALAAEDSWYGRIDLDGDMGDVDLVEDDTTDSKQYFSDAYADLRLNMSSISRLGEGRGRIAKRIRQASFRFGRWDGRCQ